jgi:hypothetical protein
MKSILIISAILGIALQRATADGEVGRYQLFVAHVDFAGGTNEAVYRIDTATGETSRLVESHVPIPEAKRDDGSKEIAIEGWVSIENSLKDAAASAQRVIDSIPENSSKKP